MRWIQGNASGVWRVIQLRLIGISLVVHIKKPLVHLKCISVQNILRELKNMT